MSHHITTDESGNLTSLTIRAPKGNQKRNAPPRAGAEVRISKGPRNRGGLVVKVTEGSRAYIQGEDLSALRLLLAELHPCEFEPFAEDNPDLAPKPRWTQGDLVLNESTKRLYEREEHDNWRVLTNSPTYYQPTIDDDLVSSLVDQFPEFNIVLRQASAGIGVSA